MAKQFRTYLYFVLAFTLCSSIARASDLTVLSSGAYEHVASQLAQEYEKATGNHVTIISDTNGALVRKVRDGQRFDLAILAESGIRDLDQSGYLAKGTIRPIAKVGIGICVRAGAPKLKVDTEEAFRVALLQAISVTYIDPKAGGSSGIYVESLFTRLGILDQMKPKVVLKQNGRVADLVATGTAAMGIQQISEILAVKGVTYLGPLPAALQNFTTYVAAMSSTTPKTEAAGSFQSFLTGDKAGQALEAAGMAQADSAKAGH